MTTVQMSWLSILKKKLGSQTLYFFNKTQNCTNVAPRLSSKQHFSLLNHIITFEDIETVGLAEVNCVGRGRTGVLVVCTAWCLLKDWTRQLLDN